MQIAALVTTRDAEHRSRGLTRVVLQHLCPAAFATIIITMTDQLAVVPF